MCMNFYYFLSYLSAIDLNRLTCVNKSYNIMISSNDRLYQDLYEKYFNKIKINSNVKEEVVVEVEQEEKEDGKFTRKEYNYSSFSRSFTIPESVETESIDAKYENGELKITLPKKEKALKVVKEIAVG